MAAREKFHLLEAEGIRLDENWCQESVSVCILHLVSLACYVIRSDDF